MKRITDMKDATIVTNGTVATNHSGAMEQIPLQKNGRIPKSQMSRGNIDNKIDNVKQ